MARLIYAMNASVDGYTADTDGNFDWTMPDEELHRFFNDFERPHGIHLYGRRMYETMAIWEDDDFLVGMPEYVHEYAKIWRAADKVVYSRTLKEPSTPRTRIESDFNPEAIRRMKAEATTNISIAGPGLAAEALKAGLVDEYHVVFSPVIVGGGTPILPPGLRLDLELLDERRFTNGTVHLHYRVK
jgi:dihydrofolate reductase